MRWALGPAPSDKLALPAFIRWVSTTLKKLEASFNGHVHGWTDVDTYGASGNGVSDDTAALQAALRRGGLVILRPGATYRISAALSLVSDTYLLGRGATIQQETAGTAGLVVSGAVDNVRIADVTLVGPGHTADDAGSDAVQVTGASAAAPMTNLTLDRVTVRGWGFYGCYLKWVEGFLLDRFVAEDIWYAGIMGLSVKRGRVLYPEVTNVVTNSPSVGYGIQFTRASTSDLTTDPRSEDIRVVGARVRDVVNWVGMGTHGGWRVRFVGGTVTGCYIGVDITRATNGVGAAAYAPLECDVINVEIDSEVDDGSAGAGLNFVGAGASAGSYTELATGKILGCTIKRHGDESSNSAGAMYLATTAGLIVDDNTFDRPSPSAILADFDNYNLSVTRTKATDPWSDTQSVCGVLVLRSDYNTGEEDGNRLIRGTLSGKTNICTYGIRVYNQPNNRLRLGSQSDYTAATSRTIEDAVAARACRTHHYRTMSADRGDASVTLVAGVDHQVQRFATPLTANRTVTLSVAVPGWGGHFRVVRAASATGAFTLSVGGLKSLAAGQWCDVEEEAGSVWVLTAFGTL